VEELTDKAPHYEIGNQTEFIIEREETPFQIPVKRGVDKKTLVQDNELFKFDREVEPILSVLCGKTLEFARMEVLEEEELRVMKSQQQHFTELNKTELSDAQRMEQMEHRKLQEFERKKALERERKKNKIAAHRKVCARTLAKQYMSTVSKCSFQYLKDVGYFVEPFQTNVLESNVLPWLYSTVESLVGEMQVQGEFSDIFVGSNLNHELELHEKTVQAERDRKEAVKRGIEEAAQKKLEDKRKRKQDRDLAKKVAGLKALKEDLNAKFIAKGENKDSVLS
jgi:hypothetical protein